MSEINKKVLRVLVVSNKGNLDIKTYLPKEYQNYEFQACTPFNVPPYTEWEPVIVIMEHGEQLPKNYSNLKVNILRAVWKKSGGLLYLRPDDDIVFV